jgi:O-antigen/teichoic acid export membrane protein
MGATAYTSTGSFKDKLLSGVLWRACNVLAAFVFNAMLVNQLGAVASAGFFYLLNNLFFAVLLLGIGLESGISFYNARKEISISHLFSLGIAWSVLGALLFWAANFFIPLNTLNIRHGHFFFTAYVLGSLLTTFLSAIYFSNHDSKTPNLVATVVNVLLILILPKMPWVQGRISFELYTVIYLCAAFFSAIVLVLLLLRKKAVFSMDAFGGRYFKPLLLFSFYSFVLGLGFNLLKRSDFWLVNRWCSAEAAGNYFQASKVIQLLLLLPALASFSLYPLIVESIKENEAGEGETATGNKVAQLVGLYFLLAVLLGLGMILIGYWVFPWLYGSSFNSLYWVVILLVPGLVFFAATYPLTTFFSGKNQNIGTIVFLSISILVLFLCNIFLTPKYGIYGAAVSSSVANFVYFFLMLRKFLVQNKMPFSIKYFIGVRRAGEMLKNLVKV